MTNLDDATLQAIRANARRTWATGDYPQVGERLKPIARQVVEAASLQPAERVLDVGCGAGGVTVPATSTGADVIGIDQTDAWFDAARADAAAAGVTLDLRVADAEDLPFADASFDVVLSNFAHIFAPRHEVVAAEMSRVLRPGGRLVVTSWVAEDESVFGAFLPYLPPPPAGVGSPMAWGEASYLAERFGADGIEVTVTRHATDWDFADVDAFFAFLFEASGPWQLARAALEASGRFDEAFADARSRAVAGNAATDGTFRSHQPYLLTVGTRRA